MDGSDSKSIARAWLEFQKNWWAWDKLDELCRLEAELAWPVLIELTALADSRELLEDIGVGPLEDFVNYHAGDFIDELESQSAASDGLRAALTHTQVRDANHPQAARLTKLGCRVTGVGKQADAFDDHS